MPPAARITDRHTCPKHPPNVVVEGESTVIVGYQPQSRVTDAEACGAKIAKGEPTVIIEGRDAARKGDPTSHGGTIASGCPTGVVVSRTCDSSAVTDRVHPSAGTIVTSCGRAESPAPSDVGGPASVRNVGAPFRNANPDSIQLVRTDISRP